jgi:hypothetical protein
MVPPFGVSEQLGKQRPTFATWLTKTWNCCKGKGWKGLLETPTTFVYRTIGHQPYKDSNFWGLSEVCWAPVSWPCRIIPNPFQAWSHIRESIHHQRVHHLPQFAGSSLTAKSVSAALAVRLVEGHGLLRKYSMQMCIFLRRLVDVAVYIVSMSTT